MSTYTVESFNTGARQTVNAADWQSALDSVQGDQFTVVKMPDGRYMAGCNENSVMPVAGGHYADTPDAAAASLREHYAAVKKPARTQPPVNAPQCCVLYLENGEEKRTAWMSRERAQQALTVMQAKYGERNAIIYVD